MEDAPKNEIPKSECPDIWIRDKTAVFCHHSSDDKWKRSVAGEGGNKKRFQYWTDSSGAILYFRALQSHSGRNFIDPSLQNNVLILDNFFKYNYHVGCAINLHSINNSGLIPTNLSKKQNKRILTRSIRELASCTGRKITTRKFGSTSTLLDERNKVLSNTIERHHSSRNTPNLMYPASCSDGNWKNQTRESICFTSTFLPKNP